LLLIVQINNLLKVIDKALHSELLTELSGRFPRIFRNFRSTNRTPFFWSFRKVQNFQISEISKNFWTFGKTSFRNFWNFSEISELFPNFFPNFSKLFDRKTGFFALKPQILHHFFEIFEIYVHFQIITELFSELKFPNFSELFCKNSASSKILVFSKKFPNFENRTFPKLAKTKSSEISV